MIKHSTSHGCATLVCTVTAGLIVYLMHRYVPDVLELGRPVAATLVAVLGSAPFFTEENLAVLVVACGLAFIWGIAFKLRYDR